jgi:hypothetical protein
VFTSNVSVPSEGDWGGIIITDSAIPSTIDSNENYIEGSIVKYCEITFGEGLETNVNFAILNNRITNNTKRGITNTGNSIIKFNTIENNVSPGKGGGIYNTGYSVISNNTIQNNVATNAGEYDKDGGGICSAPSQITYNTIVGNSSNSNGGGISCFYATSGSTIIDNNTITDNHCNKRGGGISLEWNPNAIIRNNTVSRNSSGWSGPAIFIQGSDGTSIENNLLMENEGAYTLHLNNYDCEVRYNKIENNSGDGIYSGCSSCPDNESGSIEYNIIKNNLGNGIYINRPYNIKNNTLEGNSGDGIYFRSYESTKQIDISYNSILSNSNRGIYVMRHRGSTTISNNTIQNNTENGISNIDMTYIAPSHHASVLYNIITNNNIGIYSDSPIDIRRNDIKQNITHGIQTLHVNNLSENNIYNNGGYDFYYMDSVIQDALNNYWGTTNSSEIMNSIYDYYDDITLGPVTFDPFAITEFTIIEKKGSIPWIPLLLLNE